MFFFLCVCECSLTSAKSVQPDLFKVSANEANIKGERMHPLWGAKPLLRPWKPSGPFFIRRPWPKCIFSHFVAFGRGRNAVFAVFHSSAVAESRFSSFSAFRRPPTSVFSQFLHFVGRRRTVFTVFCVSSVADEQFSSFFARRLQAKRCFSHFLHFAYER